jgi:DNA-binding transcriptional LysR family regulator
MDRLGSMSLLVTVAEAGSLSAASRKLRVPVATVSRRISELEAQLKARLLNRSSRGLTLTDSGTAYVQACRRILGEVEEAERAVSGEYSNPIGSLTITATMVFGRLHVVPVAVEFLKAYPDVDLRLVLHDRVVDLIEERVDLGIRLGQLPDSSLVAKNVGSIRRVICASPTYLESRGSPQTPQDLVGHDCITFATGLQHPDAWDFCIDGAVSSVPVRSRLFVTSAEAAVDAAMHGIGVARVFSYHVADALQTGTLILLLQAFEPPPLPVSLVYTPSPRLPLKLRIFLDFAAPRLKARLAAAPGETVPAR